MPWNGVDWSLTYLGFLTYIWIVTTYSFRGADIAMAAALAGLFVQREPFILPRLIAVYSAFILWATIGYAGTEYPDAVSVSLNSGWKVGLISLVAVNALRSPSRIRFFTFVFLAAYALYPVRGALFNYVGGNTVFGRALWNYAYGNPNDLAALTLFPLAMSIGVYRTEPPGWPRFAALIGVVLLPVVIVLTQSRGAFLALTVFAIAAVAGSSRKLRIIVSMVFVLGIVVLATPRSAWERFAQLKNATGTENLQAVDAEGSAKQRFEIWRVAAAIIRDNPVSGVGLGAYPLAHEIYAQRNDFSPIAAGRRDTHSTYLNVMAEVGAIGFLLFMATFGATMWRAERIRRIIRDSNPAMSQQLLYLNLGLVSYFIAGLFGSFAGLTFPYVYAALIVAMSLTAERQLNDRKSFPPSPSRSRIAAI